MPGTMQERMLLEGTVVKLRIKADFDDMVDTAQFFYEKDGEYVQVGGSIICITRWIISQAAVSDFSILPRVK